MTTPRPFFSSGPCCKRPGWSVAALEKAYLGRSHRSAEGKNRLKDAVERTKSVLGLPKGYEVAIVAGSDTGAVEMALWNLLGARGVDVLSMDAFSADWAYDVQEELKLPDVRVFKAPYGEVPDLEQLDFSRDVVLVWNATTSGACLPADGAFIPENREGLVICDATSAAFAMPVPFEKLDVVTFSWQKSLGGEAAHGMLAMSPRALKRLEEYTPPRPLPKIFRLKSKGKIGMGIFEGETINTPSMLCVEDYADALRWAESLGGAPGLYARTQANYREIEAFVARCPDVAFLAADSKMRSTTSVCLKIVKKEFCALSPEDQAAKIKELCKKLEKENVGYDLASYKSAPAGLRIWAGPTVEAADIRNLLAVVEKKLAQPV